MKKTIHYYYCDCCGKEQEERVLHQVELPLIYKDETGKTTTITTKKLDLCPDCKKTIATYIYDTYGVYFQEYEGVTKWN